MSPQKIDKNTQKKIIRIIKAFIPDAHILLFGSRARNTHSDWSDIDIAIESQQPLTRFDISEIKNVFDATNIPYKIDIVDIKQVPIDMQKIIAREGISWTE